MYLTSKTGNFTGSGFLMKSSFGGRPLDNRDSYFKGSLSLVN